MATQIKIRRGTAAQWSSANPTLADGELGFETDTKKFKLGNGLNSWSDLGYVTKNISEIEAQFEPKNVNIQNHIIDESNPHNVTKDQVGLANVDNTSDLNKPISNAAQAALNLKLDASVYNEMITDTNEPTGHVDRSESVLSFDNSTRTFSISPASTSFSIYTKGNKRTFTSTQSIQIPDVTGSYFFYFDLNGNLQYATAFSTDILSIYAYTAYVYYNATLGQAIVFGEERHGIKMDGQTHSYLHSTRGTQLNSGGQISYVLGNGSSNSDAQIGMGDARVSDEDITVNITHSANPSAPFQQILFPTAQIPIYWQSGNVWTKDAATAYPIKQGATRAQYNLKIGSSWSAVEASADGKFLATYIFATTDITEPIIGILGQSEYPDLATAQAQASWSNVSFGVLPAQEMKLLYVVIYETSSAFSNAPKAAIAAVKDVRFGIDREVSAYSLNTAHSSLSGLLNDDHPQYLNESRGDLRYYTQAQSNANFEPKNANIQSHIANISNPHSVTKAQVGLGNVDDISAANLRDRSTHTGTQLAATISDFTTAVQGVTIDAAKIDGGIVSNAEFATLDGISTGVTIQSQLNGKEPTITAGTTAQYWRGDKSFQTLDKSAVGLSNVDNTADATKNVLSATKLTTARTINGVSFDGTANITIPISRNEIASSSTITTTNVGTRATLTGFSYTPAAGTWMVVFSGTCYHSVNNGQVSIALAVAGVEKADSVRQITMQTNSNLRPTQIGNNGIITVNGSQSIDLVWNITTAGTGSMLFATMDFIKLA